MEALDHECGATRALMRLIDRWVALQRERPNERNSGTPTTFLPAEMTGTASSVLRAGLWDARDA